jgi:hypothetical protein
MLYIKQRLLAVLLILGSIGMIYYGWYSLRTEGVYYLKMAAFSPLLGIGGLFLLLFPSMGGKPNTTKQRVIMFAVFGIGIVAGLVNWFLMDPGFFGFR